jgi:hypothetical protein
MRATISSMRYFASSGFLAGSGAGLLGPDTDLAPPVERLARTHAAAAAAAASLSCAGSVMGDGDYCGQRPDEARQHG